MTPAQRKARAKVAANTRWARTRDRHAATQAMREGRWQRYLDCARELLGPDATDQQVVTSAENLRSADMARLSLRRHGGSAA